MNRRITIAIVALAAMLALAAGAYAGVSHVLGNGGKHYSFDAACHRQTFVPPGVKTREGLNVIAQQTRCIVHRPSFARCIQRLGEPPVVRQIRKDDWTNVDKVAAYQAAIYACAIGRF